MFIDIFYDSDDFEHNDLKILNVGEQRCTPCHTFGPAVRPYYLLHFVISGQGKYYVNGLEYLVKASECFMIYAEDITLYRADKDKPWHYIWIGFNGELALKYIEKCGFSKTNHVVKYDKDLRYMYDLLKNIIEYGHDRMVALGYFNLFFAEIINSNQNNNADNSKKVYVKSACNFILSNYMTCFKISDIANSLNIDRSHLSRLFKAELGETPQEFLLKTRMKRAKELLRRNDITISDCARSVGYDDRVAFSKLFKKYYSISPADYKKQKFNIVDQS